MPDAHISVPYNSDLMAISSKNSRKEAMTFSNKQHHTNKLRTVEKLKFKHLSMYDTPLWLSGYAVALRSIRS